MMPRTGEAAPAVLPAANAHWGGACSCNGVMGRRRERPDRASTGLMSKET